MDDEVLGLIVVILSSLSLFHVLRLRRRLKRFDPERLELQLSDLTREVKALARARKEAGPADRGEGAKAPVAKPVAPAAPATPVAPVKIFMPPPPTPPPLPSSGVTKVSLAEPLAPPTPEMEPAAPRVPSRFEQSLREVCARLWQWLLVGEEYRPKDVTMEFAVATTWLVRAGIVAILFGVGFFLKWSIDRNLLGPTARVAMSIALGLVMLVGGMRLLGRRWKLLGQGFVGGGLAVLYFSMYALGPLYHLIESMPIVFGLMILITIGAGVLALAANSMLVAIFGIIGGLLTPVLLRTGTPNLPALYGYLVLLNLGILALACVRPWRWLNYLGFAGTWLLYAATVPAQTRADTPLALTFLAVFFAAQSTVTFIYNLRRGVPATTLDLIHLALNGGLFSLAAYARIVATAGRPWPALMTLILALYYVLHVAVFVARDRRDRGLLIALLGLAGFYTTLTMPLALSKESLTMAWALQALMFVWLGRRVGSHFVRQLGYGLYLLTMVRLFAFELPRIEPAFMGRQVPAAYWAGLWSRVWTMGVAIGSLAGAFFLERRAAPAEDAAAGSLPDTPDLLPGAPAGRLFFWGAVAFLFLYLHLELHAMFGFWRAWRPSALTLLWCGAALAFLAGYRRSGAAGDLAALLFFAAGAIVKTFAADLAFWRLTPAGYFAASEWTAFLALTRWLGFGALLALLIGGWRGLARSSAPAGLAPLFGYTALALLWFYTTIEINSLLHWRLPAFRAGGLSLLWTAFALAFVTGGIWRDVRPIRLAGLALFLVVVIKIFMFDLRHMPAAYRVLAFMLMGVLLLLGSFAYLRASRKFATGAMRPQSTPPTGDDHAD